MPCLTGDYKTRYNFLVKSAGNAALNGLFVIVVLMLVLSGAMALVSAGRNYASSLARQDEREKDALAPLNSIKRDMALLTKDAADGPQSKGVLALPALYSEYELRITDVSSGINERFLPESLTGKEAIKTLVAQNVEEDLARYGWIHALLVPEKMSAEMKKDFSREKNANPFPLINSLPLVNVHFLSERSLRAFVSAFSIADGDVKSDALFNRSRQDFLQDNDIRSILGVREDNLILAVLGCKTAFWQIQYKVDNCTVTAIFAAVPDKKKEPRKVDHYRLMERSVSFE
jgi:hypothetical protein